MTTAFTVVTDITEIREHEERLKLRLKKALRHRRNRVVAYPGGREERDVFFETRTGKSVRAWSPFAHDNKLVNLFIFGEPDAQDYLVIDVQLNFPSQSYDRSLAGAFVIDADGEVFLAHRGHLTRTTKLNKQDVLREFAARTISAEDADKESELILICALEEGELVNRLFDFAEEARDVATELGNRRQSPSPEPQEGEGSPEGTAIKLRDYFDEHSGEGNTSGYAGGRRIVTHGLVVKALEKALRASGATQKSQAIDLAVLRKSSVRLFEVKTSTRTTDVYTGVGQLLLHGEAIQEAFKLTVERFLVVPKIPNPAFVRHMSRRAGITVATYEKTDSGYIFVGLPTHP